MLSFIYSCFSCFALFVLSITPLQKYPEPLDAEEERACFQAMITCGDEDARRRLIEHNLRLVVHVVRKYYSSGNSDELISTGSVGLIKAVDTYKPDGGTRFATYAVKCIQNEILMQFRAQKKLVGEVSINEAVDSDKDGNPLTYIDVIGCDDTVCDDIDRKIKLERLISYIKEHLSGREKQIIILRYGLGLEAPQTQREVAELLGISRSYVSRLEKSVLERIKEAL